MLLLPRVRSSKTRFLARWASADANAAEDAQHETAGEQLQVRETGENPQDSLRKQLEACIERRDLSAGRQLHSRILKCGLQKEVYLGNLLVSMYGKCGGTSQDVRRAFDGIEHKSVVSWNALMSAQHLCGEDALSCFHEMLQQGERANAITFVTLLKASTASRALQQGSWIHACVLAAGFQSDMVLGNVLVDLYGKCGQLQAARDIFCNMRDRNLVTWTIMLAAFGEACQFQAALSLYRVLLLDGEFQPNKVTFITVLGACAGLGCLETGNFLRRNVAERGLQQDLEVGNALVNVYGKAGAVDIALEVFEEMEERDLITWSTLIAAYAQNGYRSEAFFSFQSMLLEGVAPKASIFTVIPGAATEPAEAAIVELCVAEGGFDSEVAVANAVLSMHSKCGLLDKADGVFQQKSRHNLISWNSIIAAHTQHGNMDQAMHLFRQMQMEGVVPDRFTLVSVLDACSPEQGKQIHGWLAKATPELDAVVSTALINMYGRSGCAQEAREIFDSLEPQCTVVPWASMLRSYVQEGFTAEAFQLFEKMLLEAVRPSVHTYASLLAACTSPDNIKMGKLIQQCVLESGWKDDVLDNALLSMLSRCSSLKDFLEAYEMLDNSSSCSLTNKQMARTSLITALVEHSFHQEAVEVFHDMLLEGMKPDKVAFTATLNACSRKNDYAQGKRLHSLALASMLEPGDLIVCSALVSMYVKSGHIDVALRILNGVDRSNRHAASATDMWNAYLSACVQEGHIKSAVQLFHRMQLQGVKTDRVTFLSLLGTCATQATSRLGKLLHTCAGESGLEHSSFVKSALVDMHGKLGNLPLARELFDHGCRSIASWNAMVSAYSLHGRANEALLLFWKLQQAGYRPNRITFSSVLSANGMVQASDNFLSMLIDHGITPTLEHYSRMVHLLCTRGRTMEAREMIDKVPVKMRRDLSSILSKFSI